MKFQSFVSPKTVALCVLCVLLLGELFLSSWGRVTTRVRRAEPTHTHARTYARATDKLKPPIPLLMLSHTDARAGGDMMTGGVPTHTHPFPPDNN